jgi:hypothetical protein
VVIHLQVDKLLEQVVNKHKRVDAVASLIGNVTMNPAGGSAATTQQWSKGPHGGVMWGLGTESSTAEGAPMQWPP